MTEKNCNFNGKILSITNHGCDRESWNLFEYSVHDGEYLLWEGWIENPNAESSKELIVFRDSFASPLAPLLASGYKKITLVDIRYLPSPSLQKYIQFQNQDVLFLYSTSVLNHSKTLK